MDQPHDGLTDQRTAEKIWRNLQDLLMRNGRILAKSELAFTYAREDLARAPRFTYARDDQGPHLGVCVHITTKAWTPAAPTKKFVPPRGIHHLHVG